MDIPKDIMEAANACVDRFTYMNDTHWREFVAEAIMEERERCAKKVEGIAETAALQPKGFGLFKKVAAQAIRNPSNK